MKKKLLLLVLIATTSITTTSFSTAPSFIIKSYDDSELLRQKWNDALGTFQFQIINSRSIPQVPVEVIEEIEKNRDEKNIVYLPYKENIRIMILSKETIKGKYEKLETFAYLNE